MHGAVVNPIPPGVVARWSATWAAGVHPSRPWWRQELDTYAHQFRWYRVDRKHGPLVTHMYLDADKEIEEIDAARPLPAPPPMPGQVWQWAEGDETMIVRVAPAGADGVADVWRVWTGLDVSNGVSALVCPRVVEVEGGSRVKQWPPPGAILVAGPSPHGFNVPWSGS